MPCQRHLRRVYLERLLSLLMLLRRRRYWVMTQPLTRLLCLAPQCQLRPCLLSQMHHHHQNRPCVPLVYYHHHHHHHPSR